MDYQTCHLSNISKSDAQCPPPAATLSDNRLRNCPIARSITSWPICSQQVCRISFSCSTSQMRRGR